MIRRLRLLALAPALAAAPAFLSATPGDSAGVEAVLVTIENDKFFAGSDRHYTQGLRVQLGSHRDVNGEFERRVDFFLRRLPWHAALEDAKATFAFGQDIFTPTDTETAALIPTDRPYAAWLYLAAGYHAIITPGPRPGRPALFNKRSFSAEITYGIVGAGALGEQAQNGWHDVINVPHSQGWHNQLRSEPGLNFAADWRYRWRRGHLDVIPRLSLALGNIHTHFAVGAALRLGFNLPEDFGADLIRPAGAAAGNAPARFGANIFVSGEARAVARNIFLDGNSWKASHSVDKRPVVGDLNAGFTLHGPSGWLTRWTGARGWLLTYAQNYRTKEFHGQPKRDVFGSVSFGLLY